MSLPGNFYFLLDNFMINSTILLEKNQDPSKNLLGQMHGGEGERVRESQWCRLLHFYLE
jgi:hypothetical protein